VLKNSAIVACNLFHCNRIFDLWEPLFKGLATGLKSRPGTDDKQMVVNILPRKCWGFVACLLLAGCGGGGFDPNGTLESRPVRLDGEQVLLNQGIVECGTREDLWTIQPLGEGRALARLTQKGRSLQFSDDVQIGDPVAGVPYVQLHGSFPVKVMQMGSIRDDDAFTKTGDAKVGVKIDHTCFPGYLQLMGIRHGNFDQTANPVFRFKLDGEWLVDQVVH